MKHKMRDTSLIAWAEIMESLGDRQLDVYRALKQLKIANNTMLAEHLGLPINQITPRCNELRKYGVVIFNKKDICPFTKKLTTFWKVRRDI